MQNYQECQQHFDNLVNNLEPTLPSILTILPEIIVPVEFDRTCLDDVDNIPERLPTIDLSYLAATIQNRANWRRTDKLNYAVIIQIAIWYCSKLRPTNCFYKKGNQDYRSTHALGFQFKDGYIENDDRIRIEMMNPHYAIDLISPFIDDVIPMNPPLTGDELLEALPIIETKARIASKKGMLRKQQVREMLKKKQILTGERDADGRLIKDGRVVPDKLSSRDYQRQYAAKRRAKEKAADIEAGIRDANGRLVNDNRVKSDKLTKAEYNRQYGAKRWAKERAAEIEAGIRDADGRLIKDGRVKPNKLSSREYQRQYAAARRAKEKAADIEAGVRDANGKLIKKVKS